MRVLSTIVALVLVFCFFLLVASTQAEDVVVVKKDTSSSRSLNLKVHKHKHHKHKSMFARLVPNYKFFIAIGRCEQPGDGKWGIAWQQNYNHSFPGGLGIWKPLWTEDGISGVRFAPSADKATILEQMLQAQMIINKYGVYAWGCTGVALSQASVKTVSDSHLRWATKRVYALRIARHNRAAEKRRVSRLEIQNNSATILLPRFALGS